ncbi:hypothetical protein B0J11DRAFT_569185 [Dendryphion nanum]|uniref:Rhodopsin domain-containing protein n=1 Tax=Dendryphion nanum TaxID=256645 RepID=A0A9P9DPP6_9PLEO|nr:hypothetical protein B0J11DRAFT_569185 [Dendryphion nanum]
MDSSAPGYRVTVVTLTFTVIAGLAAVLRLFTRFAVVRKGGLEDALIALSAALSVGLAIETIAQVQNGLGKHIKELTPSDMVDSQKAFWASIWMYNLSLSTTKASILLLYLRIFQIRKFRIVCGTMLGFVGLYGLWTFVGSIFLCFPINFFWDKTVQGGKCLDQQVIWFTNSTVNIVQDVLILLLPMPVLRKLEIPTAQKKALMLVFALGGLVCVISIIRLQSLVAISNSVDPTFDNMNAAILSAVETNVAIVTACLPFFRPFLSWVMPRQFPSPSSRYAQLDEEQPSEMLALEDQQASIAAIGARAGGQVRQVTIGSGRSTTLFAPRLPRLPENMASFGPIVLGGEALHARPTHSSHSFHWSSHRLSNRLSGIQFPRRPWTPRNQMIQKPLPITPFPLSPDWTTSHLR